MPQPLSIITETFLQHLRVEEQFLAEVLAKANDVYAALRAGDMRAANAVTPQLTADAAGLRAASAQRAVVAADLARALGLPVQDLKLTLLVENLPDPLRADVDAARARLTAATAELAAVQTRNANLLAHLRSFFRDVLADLTADDTPARYGPSGNWLAPSAGSALLTPGYPQ
ncbi:flagellar biosynthesis protein : : FlgN [Gemmata massiliana]|uniref:Flagellar biosynthesis protein:: FlgN n=1 Tax=Gemmata massiliana TaxID=1210884 RepID=A0A6P2D8D3_9BACT|nr:flagellar export chaperone FlgN [Gemmata massiliana]VTR96394.1 flagellar biosynthesis protein : : FlgN [Gemmata massiliana]